MRSVYRTLRFLRVNEMEAVLGRADRRGHDVKLLRFLRKHEKIARFVEKVEFSSWKFEQIVRAYELGSNHPPQVNAMFSRKRTVILMVY